LQKTKSQSLNPASRKADLEGETVGSSKRSKGEGERLPHGNVARRCKEKKGEAKACLTVSSNPNLNFETSASGKQKKNLEGKKKDQSNGWSILGK